MLAITQTPLFSYEATQSATRIVKDFVYGLYFPVHGLSSKDIFTYCPTLISIESMVYQVDLVAENAKYFNVVQTKNEDFQTLTMQKYSFLELLKKLDFYDSQIERQLAMGEEFVKLENKVTAGGLVEHSEVIRIAELRSSDVRLLHCILFHLLGKSYNEKLLSLLWSVEVIADIVNDFLDYADDVNKDQYNTYRMFVKLYKEKAPDYIKVELDKYENSFKDQLNLFPIDEKQRLISACSQFLKAHSAEIPQPIIE
ncbi:hypothetical protein A6S26_34440 [Nostoc sp. ATCC 43529]|nr:hypothetical protein A6S26_34440 [Nostoc sp. ATCC 43529]